MALNDKVGHPEQLGANWELDGMKNTERWWLVQANPLIFCILGAGETRSFIGHSSRSPFLNVTNATSCINQRLGIMREF